MQITVVCPRCESNYQLDANLRGKKIRCTNPICRAVIEVRDDSKPAPPLPVVEAAPQPAPAPKPSWADAPPPVRSGAAPSVETPAASPSILDFPSDFPGDDDSPLSLGSPATEATTMPTVVDVPAPVVDTPPQRRSRRPLLVVGTLLLLLAGGVTFGVWRMQGRLVQAEDERFQQAEKFYEQQEFGDAVTILQSLYRDYPKGRNATKYRFLAELSDIRRPVYGRNGQAEEIAQDLDRVLQFVAVYRNDPLLKDRHGDLWQTLQQLSKQLAKQAEEKHAPQLLDQAKRSWAEAQKFQPPPGVAVADLQQKLTAEFARVDQAVAAYLRRQTLLESIRRSIEQATGDRVLEARTLARNAGLAEDAEVAELLKSLTKAHRESVRFVHADPRETRPLPSEDAWPSIAVTPAVVTNAKPARKAGVVLSLARGVLYALDASTGDFRWARRVGVDTHLPPLRVPADAITPELVLAVSSDQRSVAALVADTGALLWRQSLNGPCVGQPVLAGRRLLVPTLAGEVEEIDLREGRLLGAYALGQPLPLGGVAQPGSSLVHFPADQFCVVILDTSNRTCAGVWYTEHAAGAMRHLPVMLTEEKAASVMPWLLLPSAKGRAGMELTPYPLPIKDDKLKPSKSVLSLHGPVSHAPWHDREKLIQLTENGQLSMWGVRRKGEREPLLAPIWKDEQIADAKADASRSLVVHADADNVWTLARGKLQRLQKTLHPQKGAELVSRWSLPLGSPLHVAEVRTDDEGHATLFVTTQLLDRSACLCSAIDADQGTILWQRQLGILPQQPLVALGSQIFAQDDGHLLRFDLAPSPDASRWRSAGVFVYRSGGDAQHRLLASDGKLWQLSWPARKSGECMLAVQPLGIDAAKPTIHTIPSAPLGAIAIQGGGEMRLPLANGVLVALLGDTQVNGPDWRASGADEDSPGHVVALGAGEFVVTDGSTGLTRYRCTDLKTWEKRSSHALAHRIVAAPLALPGEPMQLIVADASDTITLLDANSLAPLRSWKLPGKLTQHPALLSKRIACVVDQKRLACLDPAKETPAWEYSFVADLVGPPVLVDDEWLVSDVSGQFTRLDPATGRTLGAPQRLHANAAASASPLVVQGRVHVPLTDGTMVELPTQK